ncbi:MAG: SH3 domain-containing protein [Synechococcaceae cyanobacterium ELA739]
MVSAAPLRLWPAWRWAALLGFALMAPAALPAGGGDRRLPEVRRRVQGQEPLLSQACLSLRCAPEHQAPVLAHLDADVPLRVLRHWFAPGGRPWLRVEASTLAGEVARGWLPG